MAFGRTYLKVPTEQRLGADLCSGQALRCFLLPLLYVMSAPWLYPGFTQLLCCTQMCQLQSTVLSCCEGSMLDNGGLVMSVFFLVKVDGGV